SATDADNDSLAYAIVENGLIGAATITNAATGAFSFTPDANAFGTDSFTFKVNDGTLDSNTATVTVTISAVNDVPVAETDSVMIDEDTQVGINLLANDHDPDGDSLNVTSLSQPAGGTVVVSGNNALYTPGLDLTGDDSFTYVVNDGNGGTATGTVNVTVLAINDAPAAADQSLAADEGVPVSGTLSATDIDNDSLTFSISGNGSLGSAVVTNPATGAFTYSPNAGASGTDTFTFVAHDGTVDSNPGTVTVVVTAAPPEPNTAPLAFDGAFTGVRNVDLSGSLDANDPDGDPVTFSIISLPTMGTVVINDAATGSFTYSPTKGLYGTDSFTFKVNDG
ncbi:MAG: tandem-95 repeat protein, partial [Desulfobulbaceae bacterium]|nr:tandem-95 repeat protein [Desulfobulbaceae bacterium]